MMSPEERRRRFDEALEKEADQEPLYFWLSFVDPDKPKGQQFIGVIITRAKGMAHAIQKTHDLGINPGGEVLCVETEETPTDYMDRLLTPSILKSLSIDTITTGEICDSNLP